MTWEEYENATHREIENRIRGYTNARTATQRAEWERTRWQTVVLLNSRLPKGKQYKYVTDLIEFEWERTRIFITPEQREELFKRLESIPDDAPTQVAKLTDLKKH